MLRFVFGEIAMQGKIMIVEKNPLVCSELKSCLEKMGHSVCCIISSGEEAVREAKSCRPNLILMDIRLSGKMDGIETGRQILENAKEPVTVIFLTTCEDDRIVERAKTLEPAGYILKPFRENELRIVIEMGLYKLFMEQALKKKEEKFRLVADYTYDCETWKGADGEYIYISPACERITEYPRSELMSGSCCIENIVHPEDRELVAEHYRKFRELGEYEQLEFRIITKSGEERWISHCCQSVYGHDGKWLGRRGSNRDITRKKKTTDELIKTKKLESFGILAGGLCHDYNNILFAILGNLNLIQDSPLPEEIVHNLKELESAALKARELTRKLISISKGEMPVKKLTRAGESIINTTNMALSGSRIKSHMSLDENLWPVEIDEGQICQAFYNIVINSKEALEEEGEIRVEAENVVLEKDNAFVMPPGKYIRIVFRDEGPGIDKKYLDNIFDPYFSTKQRFTDKGLGLGLTIAHSIVKKHDGNILVDSEVGLGTTCTILLLASDKRLEEEKQIPGRTIAGRGKILVMDDDEMIRRLYSRLLKRLGYECFVAVEGEEAVRMYRVSMDTGDVFDAVILDLNVKHGMDGKEAIRKLREMDPSIRCVLVTSSTEPLSEKYVKKLGFLDALYKPCGLDEISRVLHEVLN